MKTKTALKLADPTKTKTTPKLTDKQIADLQRLAAKQRPRGLINTLLGGIFTLVSAIVTRLVIPLLRWLIALLFAGLTKLVIAAGQGVKEMATGKHRGAFLPVWPLLFAALIPFQAIAGWFALGAGFAGTWVALWAVDHEWSLADKLPGQAASIAPRLYRLGAAVRAGGRSLRWSWNRAVGRKVFSDRELLIVAAFCLALSATETMRLFTPAWFWLLAMSLLTMYPVALWVDGRRIRPTPPLNSFQEIWNRRVGVREVRDANKVIVVEASLPELSGRWLSWDDRKHQGIWELDSALAHEAKGRASEVELALSYELSEIRRGSMELKHNKRDHVRHLVVRYTPDPIGDAGKVGYFEGPTLERDGRYLAGVTPAGIPIFGRLFRKAGAAFTIVVGSTGAGKGVIFRTMLVNAFSSPNVYVVAVDGKGGTGIPWARLGSDLYARTVEQWALAIELTYDILQARKHRYGLVGKDQWSPFTPLVPGEPCDPHFFLPIDEIQEIVKAYPQRGPRKLHSKMETISAQGRSVGVSGALSTQFGLVTDYWTNIIRTNFMGGGTTFIGKVGGRQAKQAALQDVQDVDPSSLPDFEGWFVAISRIDDAVARDHFRGLFLPTEADREDGKPAPFGVAEEVIPRVVQWAQLHPADQAIVDSYRERWEAAGQAAPIAAAFETRDIEGDTGADDDGERRLRSVPDVPDPEDGEARVLRALDEATLNTSELARATDLNRSYLSSDLLKRLESEGVITRDDDKRWRRVA